MICGGYAVTLLFAVLSDRVASSVAGAYEGEYIWQGEQYTRFKRTVMSTGYVDEYAGTDGFCER